MVTADANSHTPTKTAEEANSHTPIKTPKGQVLPGNPGELQEMANDAARSGDHGKAVHLYTMAIDLLARGMARDNNGVAATKDLVALNKSSNGQLGKLLSNRSLMYLKEGDVAAALEDADTCTRADPSFEKGHMRLVAALEASGRPFQDLLEAVEQGLAACPDSEMLVNRKWSLKKAIANQPAIDSSQATQGSRNMGETAIEATRRLADDPSEPRHALAAADLGASFAVGAHGLEKDVTQAEKYLRIGAEGGDVTARRNLGLLLLELGRAVEAADELRQAVLAGDEEAAEPLQRLAAEAQLREREARSRLEALAEAGDPRAAQMLRELQDGSLIACS
mmetsp:Transcript_17724/g.31620  ORF Transcript_17724/g.31620 Transcript_17724/m.31620 type:complete len:337 (+) Transcript_17724:79-1089(+)